MGVFVARVGLLRLLENHSNLLPQTSLGRNSRLVLLEAFDAADRIETRTRCNPDDVFIKGPAATLTQLITEQPRYERHEMHHYDALPANVTFPRLPRTNLLGRSDSARLSRALFVSTLT